MNQYSHAVWTLKKNPEGPLVSQLDAFSAHLESLGFCRRYIGNQLRVVASFSSWLRSRKISIKKIREKHIVDFLGAENREKAISRGKYASLRRLIEFLQEHDVCQRVRKKQQNQIQKL